MLIPLGFLAASGVSAGSFDLLETHVLTGSQASVTFSSLSTYASTYQHLQLRMTGRTTTTAGERSVVYLQLNGDTGSNYSRHLMFSSDPAGSVGAAGNGSTDFIETPVFASALNSSGVFGASVVDIVDAFETTKNKTVRGLGGFMGSTSAYYHKIILSSSARYNTAAISSILVYSPGTSFTSGSRFSLYGIKAA